MYRALCANRARGQRRQVGGQAQGIYRMHASPPKGARTYKAVRKRGTRRLCPCQKITPAASRMQHGPWCRRAIGWSFGNACFDRTRIGDFDPLLPHVVGMLFVAFFEKAAICLLRKQSFNAETSHCPAGPGYCRVHRGQLKDKARVKTSVGNCSTTFNLAVTPLLFTRKDQN